MLSKQAKQCFNIIKDVPPYCFVCLCDLANKPPSESDSGEDSNSEDEAEHAREAIKKAEAMATFMGWFGLVVNPAKQAKLGISTMCKGSFSAVANFMRRHMVI